MIAFMSTEEFNTLQTAIKELSEQLREMVQLKIEREAIMRSSWQFVLYIFSLPPILIVKILYYRRSPISKSGWLARVGKRKKCGK